jgi:hypothetical protein
MKEGYSLGSDIRTCYFAKNWETQQLFTSRYIVTLLYHFQYLFYYSFVLLQNWYNPGSVWNYFFMSVHITNVPLAKAPDTITFKSVKVFYFNHYQVPLQLKSLIFWDTTPNKFTESQQLLQRSMLPTFWVLKKWNQHEPYSKLATCFEPEVGGDTFLQNVSWL